MTPEAVRRAFGGDRVERVGAGDRSVAFLVDGRHLVRVARGPGGERALGLELALAPVLAPQLPVAIPVPGRTGTVDGHRWAAHEYLHGVPVRSEVAPEGLAEQLATFLEALQRFGIEQAVECGVRLRGAADGYRSELDGAVGRDVLPLLEPDVGRAIEDGVRRLLEEPPEDRRCLVHGDLRAHHLLVDRAGERLVAVLDFGEAHLGDPSRDLGFVLGELGWGFAAAVLSHLDSGARPRSMRRAAFLQAWDAVRWAASCVETDSGDLEVALGLVTSQLRELDARC